jgi:glycosyltransferase involved in cell wall biosynthesis
MTQRPAYLFVCPWPVDSPGGVNEVLRNLNREISASGVRALLMIFGDPEMKQTGELATPFIFPLGRPTDSRRPWRAFASFAVRLPSNLSRLRRLLAREHVTVVNPHFPNLESLHFAFLKKLRLFRGRLVLSFHGSDYYWALASRGFERRAWRYLLRSADSIVACSNDLRRKLCEFEPSVAQRICTIPNGIDFDQFESEATTHTEDSGLGSFILSVGTFERQKGQDLLVNAFARVRRELPAIRLVMIGRTGAALDDLRSMIADAGLGESVTLIENLTHAQVVPWMQQASVFVLPSRREAFGIVLLEAAACRKPVVASRVGGIPEVIEDGRTGLLVPPEDVQALADAILRIYREPGEASRLAQNLHDHVKSSFTWQNAARRYLVLGTAGCPAQDSSMRAAGQPSDR